MRTPAAARPITRLVLWHVKTPHSCTSTFCFIIHLQSCEGTSHPPRLFSFWCAHISLQLTCDQRGAQRYCARGYCFCGNGPRDVALHYGKSSMMLAGVRSGKTCWRSESCRFCVCAYLMFVFLVWADMFFYIKGWFLVSDWCSFVPVGRCSVDTVYLCAAIKWQPSHWPSPGSASKSPHQILHTGTEIEVLVQSNTTDCVLQTKNNSLIFKFGNECGYEMYPHTTEHETDPFMVLLDSDERC